MKTVEQIALEALEDFDCCVYRSRCEMLLDFLGKVDEERAKAGPSAWVHLDNLMLAESTLITTTKHNEQQTGVYMYPISKAQIKRLVTQMFGEGYRIIPPSPTVPHVVELETFAKVESVAHVVDNDIEHEHEWEVRYGKLWDEANKYRTEVLELRRHKANLVAALTHIAESGEAYDRQVAKEALASVVSD